MRKYFLLLVTVAVLAFSLVLYRSVELGRGDARPAFLENLNPAGGMLGPEGIQFDTQGTLYIGDAQGTIWSLEPGSAPRIFAQLHQIRQSAATGPLEGAIHAGGIAIDSSGTLYVAAYGFAGGSILSVDAHQRLVQLFARDMGVANYVVITKDNRHLWVSDYRRRGRLLRYPIAGSRPAQPDLMVTGLRSPNGLALDAGEKSLYAAETYSGDLVRVDLTATEPKPTPVANLKGSLAIGSLDGLAFDPRDKESRFLYVAENLRGIFTVLDLKAKPAVVAKRIRLSTMGGRPCPASMAIHDGYLYFTDLWSCSPIRILLGFPDYRAHAYRFPVIDRTSLF